MNIRQFIFVFIAITITIPFTQSQTVVNTSEQFEIVYLADVEYAVNSQWLNNIRDDWKATAINLRIFKSKVEDINGNLKWDNPTYNVDDAIQKISTAGLNIYIRINFTLLNLDAAIKNYSKDDFHTRSDGKIFLNAYNVDKPLLNLTSKKSLKDMSCFLSKTVKHFNKYPDKIRSRIKLIVPTLSSDDETELPFSAYDDSLKTIVYNVLSGFSNPEIDAFIEFLKNKYVSINKLNESWGEGAAFKNFDKKEILIRNYNWDGIKTDRESPDYYLYENGRKDFLDFRTEELKKFIDTCSSIVNRAGFKFGVQFGSMYDGLVEFRGFYDPTPLIQSADILITDEILEYYPNFEFSANLSRSLCKYWTWKNSSKIRKRFATETNWPGYADHKPEDLIKYWSMQLRTFYQQGASCLFISHWGTVDSPNQIPQKVLTEGALKDYRAWQDTLQKFQNAPVKKVVNNYVYHLAPEQGLNYMVQAEDNGEANSFIHNDGVAVDKINGRNILEFPLKRFSKPQDEDDRNNDFNNFDFVTSYMLKNSPDYTNQKYKKVFKTGTSRYMKEIDKFEP